MTSGGGELARYFILGAQASGADVDFSFLSFYHNRSPVNIRQPASQRTPLGVAYIVPRLRRLTTDLTLHKTYLSFEFASMIAQSSAPMEGQI